MAQANNLPSLTFFFFWRFIKSTIGNMEISVQIVIDVIDDVISCI